MTRVRILHGLGGMWRIIQRHYPRHQTINNHRPQLVGSSTEKNDTTRYISALLSGMNICRWSTQSSDKHRRRAEATNLGRLVLSARRQRFCRGQLTTHGRQAKEL